MVSYSLSIFEKKIKSLERGFQRSDNYKKEMWKIYKYKFNAREEGNRWD